MDESLDFEESFSKYIIYFELLHAHNLQLYFCYGRGPRFLRKVKWHFLKMIAVLQLSFEAFLKL